MTVHDSSNEGSEKPGKGIGWVVVPAIVFAAIAGLFLFALQAGDPSKLPSALIGRPVPQTEFPPLAGLQAEGRSVSGFSSADLAAGKVSVVNFWASWCVPCVQEHPLLEDLRKRMGVDIFGVNYKDKTAAANRFLRRHGNPFTRVGVDANGRNAIEWGVYGMPETFVVNGKGEITYKHVGPISTESLESKVIPAIEAAQLKNSAAGQ